MVVSDDTALQMYEAFRAVGITDMQINRLLKILSGIPGNKSYRDTVSKLEWYHSIHLKGGR
jgi:hypothetical protein